MGAANDALWSCARRKVISADVAKGTGDYWRLTIKLACGHEAVQDFRYRPWIGDILSTSAGVSARARADRAATAVKAAGTCPCIACGPAAP